MIKAPCPEIECTGCAACVEACPRKCIRIVEDANGERHPFVDASHCVSCGRCEAACPSNNPPPFNSPIACHAAFRTEIAARRKSASGGLGAAISEYVVGGKHGAVFGTAYASGLVPTTVQIDDLAGLEALKGSKYVQSIVPDGTYGKMRALLDAGRFVAYIATPCQIAAALKIVGENRPNFLTVDLVCHGVSPTRYFTDTVAALKSEDRFKDIDNIAFRGNDGGNYALSLWRGDRLLARKPWEESPYFAGFMLGVTLRENCYSCRYARPERVADITIGDFIGLGGAEPFPYPVDNVSCVTANTPKGAAFYADLLAATPALVSVKREYGERLRYRPSLLEPFARHPLADAFRARYRSEGTVRALAKTLRHFVARHKLRNAARRLVAMPRRIAVRLYRIVSRHSGKSVVVVTWRASENYGTSLQAFALEWKLRRLGYRTGILSCAKTSFTRRERVLGVLKEVGLLPALLWFRRLLRPAEPQTRSLRRRKLDAWARRVHHVADVAYPHELRRLLRTTDCFVAGSDQIWNSYYSFDPVMYLAFAGGRRRIAYASSVGTAGVNPKYANEVCRLLGRFDAIGVREEDAARMLRRLLNRDDIVQVLDPTLLLTADEWRKVTKPAVGGYMLVYLVGDRAEYAQQAASVAERAGVDRIVVVPSAENPLFRMGGCEVAGSADPFEFASLVRNASLVCTDSFHATALAINFSVPFVELRRFDDSDERSQNSRIYGLLKRYGLEGQLYASGNWRTSLDYSPVRPLLEKDRQASLAYLRNAIEG